jgi:alpha-L-rhamnosidase
MTRAGESWTFDFGQNLAGICRLRTSGSSGARIILHHAERLRADGSLDTANLRSALARDEFVLAGGGEEETYTPRFTSHGFRYVSATGLSAPPSPDTLVAQVVSDDLPRTGWFDCSDPVLTRIHNAAVWSVRNNCRSIRTDCPQRDERQGWLGDPAEEARGEAYLFDNAAFYAKWLDDMLDAQRPDGAMPDVAPAYWAFYNDDLSWPATLAIIPGILFEQFGDIAVLARVYPHLSRWLDRMWEKAGDTYGDWGFMGMRGMNAEPFIAAAYLPHCLSRLATYATQLGETAAASVAQGRAAIARARFQERFFRSADGLYADGGATACILALAFDLAPPSQRPVLIERLISLIMARGEAHPCFGLIGAQWVNRVLQQAGHGELVHQMTVARTRPGLGYMIAQGATTLWELWDGDTADPAMSSLDHTMLTGDLLVWLYQDLAGIRPDLYYPGFARVILAPKPIRTMDWVRATYDSKTGRIESAWRRQAGKVTFDFVLPPNVQATVTLPGAEPFQISSGRHRFTRPDF